MQITQDPCSDGPTWWALYTRHQHEKVIADALAAKGFEVYLPLYQTVSRWKDRYKTLSLPLFPCYVFIHGGLDRKLQVMTTPGVLMALSRGEKVATIPESEIASLRRAVDGIRLVEPHPFLHCGDRVRVTRGPLVGIEGILIRKKNLFRLVVSVEMLAQAVSVEIDATDVEAITPSASARPTFPSNPPYAERSPSSFTVAQGCLPRPCRGLRAEQESL